MKIKVYFAKKMIDELLEQGKVHKAGNSWFIDGNTRFEPGDAYKEDTVFFTLSSSIDELPDMTQGYNILFAYLTDILPIEQNPHIQQTFGKFGRTKYEVTYGGEKFEVPGNQYQFEAFAYRGIISIKVRGKNLQSVLDCYSAIRQADKSVETDVSWKGEPTSIETTVEQTDATNI